MLQRTCPPCMPFTKAPSVTLAAGAPARAKTKEGVVATVIAPCGTTTGTGKGPAGGAGGVGPVAGAGAGDALPGLSPSPLPQPASQAVLANSAATQASCRERFK